MNMFFQALCAGDTTACIVPHRPGDDARLGGWPGGWLCGASQGDRASGRALLRAVGVDRPVLYYMWWGAALLAGSLIHSDECVCV